MLNPTRLINTTALILLTQLFFSCPNDSSSQYNYDLEAKVTMTPIKTSYVIGDTISLTVNFPNPINDRNHNTLERIEELNIMHGWWVVELTSDSNLSPDATNNITLIDLTGNRGDYRIDGTPTSSDVVGMFERLPNGDLTVDYSFTLNSTGLFWLRFGQFVQTEQEESIDTPIRLVNPRNNSRFEIYYKIENFPEENLELICENNPPYGFCNQPFGEDFSEEVRRLGSFVFKVE